MQEVLLSSRGHISGTLLRPDGGSPAGLIACVHGGGCNGGYFRLGTPSVADSLVARGFGVLLVNRPGFAGNAPVEPTCSIEASLPSIRRFIMETACDAGVVGSVGLIGHSIGGAIALMLAADPVELPIAAVAVSGIGDEAPAEVIAWDPAARGDSNAPRPETAAILLGPPHTYGWKALIQLRRVAEPWIAAEKAEIVHEWPRRWPGVAAAIRAPVHLRIAAGERVWCTGEAVVARMAARLTNASLVDAALLPDGGHAYELHRRGPELGIAQAAFMADHVARTER